MSRNTPTHQKSHEIMTTLAAPMPDSNGPTVASWRAVNIHTNVIPQYSSPGTQQSPSTATYVPEETLASQTRIQHGDNVASGYARHLFGSYNKNPVQGTKTEGGRFLSSQYGYSDGGAFHRINNDVQNSNLCLEKHFERGSPDYYPSTPSTVVGNTSNHGTHATASREYMAETNNPYGRPANAQCPAHMATPQTYGKLSYSTPHAPSKKRRFNEMQDFQHIPIPYHGQTFEQHAKDMKYVLQNSEESYIKRMRVTNGSLRVHVAGPVNEIPAQNLHSPVALTKFEQRLQYEMQSVSKLKVELGRKKEMIEQLRETVSRLEESAAVEKRNIEVKVFELLENRRGLKECWRMIANRELKMKENYMESSDQCCGDAANEDLEGKNLRNESLGDEDLNEDLDEEDLDDEDLDEEDLDDEDLDEEDLDEEDLDEEDLDNENLRSSDLENDALLEKEQYS
ncbi:hypothetical protein F4604DRAFT_1918624 [Suillus subluteus]|nr:hypothetical protein F4604DRAFT_1918624 [Suillus subluteus]